VHETVSSTHVRIVRETSHEVNRTRVARKRSERSGGGGVLAQENDNMTVVGKNLLE
jgi:hypothetical protein